MVVRVTARTKERLRCAVCHGDAPAHELGRCDGCASRCHADCLALVQGCPSLACPRGRPRPVRLAPRPPTLQADLAALVRSLDPQEATRLARGLLGQAFDLALLAAGAFVATLLAMAALLAVLVVVMRLAG